MWHTLRISREADPAFVSSGTELIQSASRSFILITGVAYLCWYIPATEEATTEFKLGFFAITTVLVFSSAIALWLLSKRPLLAQTIWLAGLVIAITLAVRVSGQPEVAFLYPVLTLVAVVTLGWPAGVLMEGVVIALALWISRNPAMPVLSSGYVLGIIAGGAYLGLLGWAFVHALLTVTLWSLYSFEQARERIEEARDQRLQLKQTQQDLIHANQELARLSDRLKAMYQIAEEARQAKEAFVANVSHELRTPLNMIIGFSEMIPRLSRVYGTKLPRTLLSDIAAIRRNSYHLAKLVDDVLDLSQVDAGRMALIREWTSFKEIVDEAALAVGALFRSKGLYLETDVPEHLPRVFCDGTRIRQVVLNLLSNAGRFTERGGVRLVAWREGEAVVVSVTDTGPGIAPEDQEKLFEPFQQLDTSLSRRQGGSGLGLSINKRFVEMHGGKLWLESQVGAGTTFYFSLPLETRPPATLAGDDSALRWFNPYGHYEPRTRRTLAPAPQVIPRFVLLDKGQTLPRLFYRYMHGFEITSVHDIAGAVDELSGSPAQALIVNAPPFEEIPVTMEQLMALPHNTPAVLCWVPGDDDAAKQLGVIRYLVKPITVKTLLSTLEELGEGVNSVLVVDDQPEVLQLFVRMLSSAQNNYRILQATSGQRALSLLRERRPDVMLLDLIMPGFDGFQVLQEKSQDPAIRDIPVVVISSRDPTGAPIVSETLTVTRSGGLSVNDLLDCIQAVSEILSPGEPPADREPLEGSLV